MQKSVQARKNRIISAMYMLDLSLILNPLLHQFLRLEIAFLPSVQDMHMMLANLQVPLAQYLANRNTQEAEKIIIIITQ